MLSLCPNKKLCGSCTRSDLEYNAQLNLKLNEINQALKYIRTRPVCQVIVPSSKTHHYRNRMDYAINFEGHVGLRQKGKWWKVLDGHTCFIADEEIEKIFRLTRLWVTSSGLSYYDRKKHTGLLRYAVIRNTRTGQSMLNVVTSSPVDIAEKNQLIIKLNYLNTISKTGSLIWSENNTQADVSFGQNYVVLNGREFITERINGYLFNIGPNTFFQTNSYAAEQLQSEIVGFAVRSEARRILDMYCGGGFFTIPLADQACEVLGIESSELSIDEAEKNARLNHSLNTKFLAVKAEEFNWSYFSPDLVIVDPPRSGLHFKVIEDILNNKPKNLIYVSCNYLKLVDDLKELTKQYTILEIKGVDMFPHTPHVEVIAWLGR